MIDIPLRVYGRKNQSVTFLIRRQPAGKLTAPKNIELEAAVVQYRAPNDPAVTTDSFEYASRSDLGVSAPAVVEIEIIDMPAALVAPVEVFFGPTLTGEMDKETIEIQNQGGAVTEGDLIVNAPWRVEVSPHYRIEPGQRRSVAITFAPDKPGDFTAELRFSSQPDRVTTLRGKAIYALEAKPAALRLQPVAGAMIRVAGLDIVNHTAEPQTVRVTGSPRLITDTPLTLSPGQSRTIMVRTSKDDVLPLEVELALESNAHRTVVPVHAEALPGVLQADSTNIDLRAPAPGGELVGTFTIRNLGGVSANADLVPDPEFQVSPNKVSLPAGGEARIDVRLIKGVNPPIEGSIYLNSGDHSQKIALSAWGESKATAPVARNDNKRSATRKPARERGHVDIPSQWSPYETDPAAPIDPVNIIRTVAMSATSCSLEWHVERTPATRFIAETRELKIENGELAKHWHKHADFRVDRIGNHFRGTIGQLQPSRMYTIRVRELNNEGEPGATVFEASITTRPPQSKTAGTIWKGLIAVVAIVGAGYVVLRRLRKSATPAFDPKKTQRMV
jgi:hypothetical protein